MRILRSLILTIALLVLFFIALNNTITGFWRFDVNPIARIIPESLHPTNLTQVRFYWLGAALLPVLYLVTAYTLWQRRPGALRVRTTTGDNLLIHPGAILKFIRVQVENHPAVVSQRIRVRQSGSRAISIRATVMIRPIASLPQIKDELETSIRDGLSQVMGIEKVDDITIILGLDEKEMNFKPGSTIKARPAVEPPARALNPVDESRAEMVVPRSEAADIVLKNEEP